MTTIDRCTAAFLLFQHVYIQNIQRGQWTSCNVCLSFAILRGDFRALAGESMTSNSKYNASCQNWSKLNSYLRLQYGDVPMQTTADILCTLFYRKHPELGCLKNDKFRASKSVYTHATYKKINLVNSPIKLQPSTIKLHKIPYKLS